MPREISRKPELEGAYVGVRATVSVYFTRKEIISSGYDPDRITDAQLIEMSKGCMGGTYCNVFADEDGHVVHRDIGPPPPRLVDCTR